MYNTIKMNKLISTRSHYYATTLYAFYGLTRKTKDQTKKKLEYAIKVGAACIGKYRGIDSVYSNA